MSESNKPPIIWIFVSIAMIVFGVNHWMSREISRSATPAQSVPATDEVIEVAQAPAVLRVPEPVVFDPAKKKRIKKKKPSANDSTEEALGASDPIYESPVNSAILVQ